MTPINGIIENEIIFLYLVIKRIITYQAEKYDFLLFLPEERMSFVVILFIYPRSRSSPWMDKDHKAPIFGKTKHLSLKS